MSETIHCESCGWRGHEEDLGVADDNETMWCPECLGAADKYVHFIAYPQAGAMPPSILDAAIAGSTALDPAGNHRTADQLRVPTFDEQEAERKRVAERIASMGRSS